MESKAVLTAILRAKRKFGPILKKARGNFGKYPNLGDVFDAIDPALEEEGLFLSQGEETEGYLHTEVSHAESGQSITKRVRLIIEKNTPQGGGSALTYSRRYGILAFFGLAAEDDDGQRAENEYRPNETKVVNQSHQGAAPANSNWLNTPIGFGKFKDKTPSQIPEKDLRNYADWLVSDAEKKEKPLGNGAKQFVDNVNAKFRSINTESDSELCLRCGAPRQFCSC